MSEDPGASLVVSAPHNEFNREFLTPDALNFLTLLVSTFSARRDALLEARHERQSRFDAGENPDFLPETAHIRADPSWRVVEPVPDLMYRRA